MALCPTGVKTTIEWQYPGEQKQRIEGADDYSITPTYSSSIVFEWRYDMGYSVLSYGLVTPSSPSSGCNGSMAQLRRCTQQRVNPQLVFDNSRMQTGFIAPIYKYRISDYAQSDLPCSNAGLNDPSLLCTKPKGYRKVEVFAHKTISSPSPEWILAWSGTRNYTPGYMLQVSSGGEYPVIYNPSTNMYVGAIPSGSGWGYFNFVPPSNALQNGWSFKVWKNEMVVYQRNTQNPPTVTYFCGEQCPPGTCECESGGVVCCYDTATGRAVKSFAK